MKNTNYSRDLALQCSKLIADGAVTGHRLEFVKAALKNARQSEKFILPSDGFVGDDLMLKSLDTSSQLHLPFKSVSLEFNRVFHQEVRVVLIVEDGMHDTHGAILSVSMFLSDGPTSKWRMIPTFGMPTTGFIDRGRVSGGRPAVCLITTMDEGSGEYQAGVYGAYVLLSFLNALQCSNVHMDRSPPSSVHRALANKKGAISYDTYRILTIDTSDRAVGDNEHRSHPGSHRSPREHLRMGHVRRYASGKTIWINSTVVAAGRGAGKVTKDYVVVA